MDFINLSKIAIKAAHSAGTIIRRYMNDDLVAEKKSAGTSRFSEVVTAADKEAESEILSQLLPSCEDYDLALLSEETEDNGSRFKKDYFWCIDPIDGTLAFINKHPGYSVSIALVAKDGTPHIGVVFDPATETLYHAVKGYGVFKNYEPWNIRQSNDYLTYVTDRELSETPHADEIQQLLYKYAERLSLEGVEEIAGGGAVINAIRVLENSPGLMLKFPKNKPGGGSIWDYAATACMYQQLNLPATNFDGGRLDLNRKDSTFMNHEGIFYASFRDIQHKR